MLKVFRLNDIALIPGFEKFSMLQPIGDNDELGAVRHKDDSLNLSTRNDRQLTRVFSAYQEDDGKRPEGVLMTYYAIDGSTGTEEKAVLTDDRRLLVTVKTSNRTIPYMVDLSRPAN